MLGKITSTIKQGSKEDTKAQNNEEQLNVA